MSDQVTHNGFPVSIPFLEFLGVQCRRAEGGNGEVELVLEEQHMNSFAMAHGGVTMTLLDVAMAMAGRTAKPGVSGVVTVEMKTTFMRPARGTLRATGRCIHQSSTLAFCEAEVTGADGAVAARATGTFKFVQPQRTGGDG